MQLTVPSWFKQRQAKAEPAGEQTYRLTAPNLGEAFVSIRKAEGDGGWSAAVKAKADGPDLDSTGPTIPDEAEAWYAAFELYRRRFIN
jgi:hypothetical protein